MQFVQNDCHPNYCLNEPSKVQFLRTTSKQTRTMTMMMTTTTTTVMNNDQQKLCQHYRHCLNTDNEDDKRSMISSEADDVNNSVLKIEVKEEDIVPLGNSGILYNNPHQQYQSIERVNNSILSHL